MNAIGGRGPFGLTLRRCLAVATPATALGVAGALLLQRLWRDEAAVEAAPGAASPLLALPLCAAAFAAVLAAVRFWPAFGRGRPGRDWIDRLQRGGLGGCGSALGGALLAYALLAAPVLLALPPWLGAPAQAFAVHPLQPAGSGLLAAAAPQLELRCSGTEAVRELRLRPLVGMPAGDWQGAVVRAFADGEPLPPLPAAFGDNRQPVRVAFPPRQVRAFTLVYESGTVPLGFDASAAEAIGIAPQPRWGNALAALLGTAAPAFVALALGALVGQLARPATALASAAAALFLGTIGGQGPFLPAVLAVLRGEWLATAAVFRAGAPSLALGAAAMIAAMFLRAKVRR